MKFGEFRAKDSQEYIVHLTFLQQWNCFYNVCIKAVTTNDFPNSDKVLATKTIRF